MSDRLEKLTDQISFNCYEDFGLFKEELNRKLQEENLDDIFLNGLLILNHQKILYLNKNKESENDFFKSKDEIQCKRELNFSFDKDFNSKRGSPMPPYLFSAFEQNRNMDYPVENQILNFKNCGNSNFVKNKDICSSNEDFQSLYQFQLWGNETPQKNIIDYMCRQSDFNKPPFMTNIFGKPSPTPLNDRSFELNSYNPNNCGFSSALNNNNRLLTPIIENKNRMYMSEMILKNSHPNEDILAKSNNANNQLKTFAPLQFENFNKNKVFFSENKGRPTKSILDHFDRPKKIGIVL